MKILQVVTYISNGSEFGGPSQVAQNIFTEINENFSCDIMALSNRKTMVDLKNYPNNSYQLYRAYQISRRMGFAGIVNFRVFLKFYRARKNYDLFHIHLARDLVTLPIAFICMTLNLPYVLQCHGMIHPSSRVSARILDKIATRIVLRKSLLVLSLSEEEDSDLFKVERKMRIERFVNAAGIGPRSFRENRIAFVGRLGADKKPEILAKAGLLLLQSGKLFEFEFIGPDSGSLVECKKIISGSKFEQHFRFHGALSNFETVKLLSSCQIMVLPSPKDRFPLAVIESLSTGTPVIISIGNGLAPYISKYSAGIVCDMSPNTVATSILTIVENAYEYQKNASMLFVENFELRLNVLKLVSLYKMTLNRD